MTTIPKKLLSVQSLLSHVLGIPVFFLLFVLLYRSSWMLELLDMHSGRMTLNVLMIMCIMLGLQCASRIPITSVRRHIHFTWLHYTLWCLAEIAAMSLFAALYLTIVGNKIAGDMVYHYFPILGWTAAMIGSVVLFPYLMLNMLFTLLEPTEQVVVDEELVRMHDSSGQLKLVVASSAIIYVQSDGNYLYVRYTEGERIKEYQLRNTMKNLEPLLLKHNIVRCQRSFFINPKFVTALRKDKEGLIVAELGIADLRQPAAGKAALASIPVSPRYYDSLSRML